MSAESPRSIRNVRVVSAQKVLPQHVSNPSALESVSGFISEIIPNSYIASPLDTKDYIQWMKFEELQNEPSIRFSHFGDEKAIPQPLILILGYSTGIQVWCIRANGEATEMLSWHHGTIKAFKILPSPYSVTAPATLDVFSDKRPLMALCDNASPGPQFCSLSFLSLKTKEQVKLIKFKNPVLNILANERFVVVSFTERIAVFNAFTLEDTYFVTTCALSPGLDPNPIALGSRWLAYAEKKMNLSQKSSGGCQNDGYKTYAIKLVNCAKSITKGIRDLAETATSTWSGTSPHKTGTQPGSPQGGGVDDVDHKGVITILDLENCNSGCEEKPESMVAHFVAHFQPIVYMTFDPSGMLILTADKRGYDFNVFKIHSHCLGSAFASVQHLYLLHRGDTMAKIQDMNFSSDSRWISVSSLRGTTHIFPVTPYGGAIGYRTHMTQHVVNKISRYQRTAGLNGDERSNSPASTSDKHTELIYPYNNPRIAPTLPETVVDHPYCQIKLPTSSNPAGPNRTNSGTGLRLISSLEDNRNYRIVSTFAQHRAYIDGPPSARDLSSANQSRVMESLFVMSSQGSLLQYDFDPQAVGKEPKDKIGDDASIAVVVSLKAQWILQRQGNNPDITLPLNSEFLDYFTPGIPPAIPAADSNLWLSQVEILTHAGPHRRLWMGPQFTFKTFTNSTQSPLSVGESQPIDVGRSKPVNMPISKTNTIHIESGSANSAEFAQMDSLYHKDRGELNTSGECRLKADLADAMLESPRGRDLSGRCVIVSVKPTTHSATVAKVVNPLGTVVTIQSDDDVEEEPKEDEVIHENCDEALFRPIVVPKPIPYTEGKPRGFPTDMLTKSLEAKTGVAVILGKPKNKVCDEKNRDKCKKTSSGKKNLNTNKSKVFHNKETDDCKDEVDCSWDYFKAVKGETEQFDITNLKSSELVNNSQDLHHVNWECLNVEKDVECKIETFEDATDCCDNLQFANLSWKVENEPNQKEIPDVLSNDILEQNFQYEAKKEQNVDSEISLETNHTFDLPLSRKNRKPKPKLGVRINANKDNFNTNNDVDPTINEVALAPQRTWSNIAASKPKEKFYQENFFDYSTIKDKTTSEAEPEEDSSQLVHIEIFSENQVPENTNDGKIDDDGFKGSNEEKVFEEKAESSSPIDTTESDDSTKLLYRIRTSPILFLQKSEQNDDSSEAAKEHEENNSESTDDSFVCCETTPDQFVDKWCQFSPK